MTLPSIIASGSADNISFANKFLEYGIEALLGDLQNRQQVGNCEPGITGYKMQNPVMCPAKTEILEQTVRVAHKVTICKEQKLDKFEQGLGSVS
jgi:hypothetical protein